MTKMEHSPLPWRMQTGTTEGGGWMVGSVGRNDAGERLWIMTPPCPGTALGSADGDAELIVRSVNSHEALVKALAKIAEHMNADNEQSYRADDPEGAMDTVYELAVAALRLAKGVEDKEPQP